MQLRLASRIALLTVPLALVLLAPACEDGSSGGGSAEFDAGTNTFEAGMPADTSTPTTDAADAAVPTDAGPLVTTKPFDTGVDDTGMPLADGQPDPHWTTKNGAGTAFGAFVKTDALGFEGYWMRPSDRSKFISPFVDTVDPADTGTYLYSTTFVLGDEVALSGASLTIRYASDNEMTAIAVNGTDVGAIPAGSYSAFETITVKNLARGKNTVTLSAHNFSGPTGMRAELDLTILLP